MHDNNTPCSSNIYSSLLHQWTGEDFQEDVSLTGPPQDKISRRPYYPHVLPSQNNVAQKIQSCLGVEFREEVDVGVA